MDFPRVLQDHVFAGAHCRHHPRQIEFDRGFTDFFRRVATSATAARWSDLDDFFHEPARRLFDQLAP